jgi:hypothetical protein
MELAEEIARLFEDHDLELTVLPRRDGAATVRSKPAITCTGTPPSDRPGGTKLGLDEALEQGITILERAGFEVSAPRAAPRGLREVVVRRTW